MRVARLGPLLGPLLGGCTLLAACTHVDRRTALVDRGVRPDEGGGLVPDGTTSPVEARLSVDGRVVQGSVRWASACHPRYLRRRDEVAFSRVAPDPGSNLLWAASGAAVAAGGGYLLARGITGTTDEQASRVPPGLALAVTGLLVAGTALHTQLSGSGWNEAGMSPEITPEPGPGLVACGPADKAPPYRLGLRQAGGATLPASQRGGEVGVVLPLGISPPPSADLVVVEGGDELAPSGRALAQIDLAPYAAFLASPPADPKPGPFLAQQAKVTRSCSPQGRDGGCDGVDRDCDGFYDLGCGRTAGALQWTVLGAGDPVSLSVTGPDGDEVSVHKRRADASGLTLEAPCLDHRDQACDDAALNVFTPLARTPMEGTYVAVVVARNSGTVWVPQRFTATLAGRAGGSAWRARLELDAKRHHRAEIAFALGPDRDGDAVIDREDACPDQPGPYDFHRPNRGCPSK